ncbi:hypothetical protein [Pedobacter agri]|uniref:hypothetical protein n=1 Tax=Pedobacter agri TaxID=454586 RepID=UPI00292F721A|nr:hypothetical protein [Pedobacter agri]
MNCNQLNAFLKDCKATRNGLSKIYVIAFSDLKLSVLGDAEYSEDENGVIISVSIKNQRNFVEIQNANKSASLKELVTVFDNGSVEINQEFSLTLMTFSAKNKMFVNALINTPVVFLNKTRNGEWLILGLDGNLNLKDVDGEISETSNQRTLTFAGTANQLISEISASAAQTLISPPEFIDGNNAFNYTLGMVLKAS